MYLFIILFFISIFKFSDVFLSPNVALRRKAEQNPESNYASRPIDGYFSSCSSTKNTESLWWQVDLLEVFGITKAAVTSGSTYYSIYIFFQKL